MIPNIRQTVRPSSSYQLELPQEICEQSDDRVSSFWLDGSPLLLQVSSYIRNKGKQLAARDRLRDRIAKHKQEWRTWKAKIHPGLAVDQATAEFTDVDDVLWVHTYLVWPHLTVYLTISGPKELVSVGDNWAVRALKSVRLTTH
jgi:hypothetical protein